MDSEIEIPEDFIIPKISKLNDAEFQELKYLLIKYGLTNIKLFYRLVQGCTSKWLVTDSHIKSINSIGQSFGNIIPLIEDNISLFQFILNFENSNYLGDIEINNSRHKDKAILKSKKKKIEFVNILKNHFFEKREYDKLIQLYRNKNFPFKTKKTGAPPKASRKKQKHYIFSIYNYLQNETSFIKRVDTIISPEQAIFIYDFLVICRIIDIEKRKNKLPEENKNLILQALQEYLKDLQNQVVEN